MLWLAHLWGQHVPFISQFTSVFFDASVILALSLVLWQFISSWIERKIAESIQEGSTEDVQKDDEWGGAAAYGRSYTLLSMIRKFIGSILAVLVTIGLPYTIGNTNLQSQDARYGRGLNHCLKAPPEDGKRDKDFPAQNKKLAKSQKRPLVLRNGEHLRRLRLLFAA